MKNNGDAPASEIYQLFTLQEQELGTGERGDRDIFLPKDWVKRFAGHDMGTTRPVIEMRKGWFNVDSFKRCNVCGNDHRALIIAFMDWYRQTADGYGIYKLSELKAQFVDHLSIDDNIRQKIEAEILDDIGADDELQRRVLEKLGLTPERLAALVESQGDRREPAKKPRGRPRKQPREAAVAAIEE